MISVWTKSENTLNSLVEALVICNRHKVEVVYAWIADVSAFNWIEAHKICIVVTLEVCTAVYFFELCWSCKI